MVSNTVGECLQRKIAQKSSNLKSKLVLSGSVNAGHYVAFKYRISFVRDLAENFGCYRFRITPDIVSKLCAQPSEVTALFNSNLSRHPFLGQVVDTDMLLCTGFDSEHAVLMICHIFAQRRMNDRKIQRSDGRCLGRQQLLADSKEISFQMKKKSDSSWPEIYKALKPYWLLELIQYRKSGSMFSSSEPVAARSDCRRLGNALCLCSPVRPAQAEQESCPKSLAVDFAL